MQNSEEMDIPYKNRPSNIHEKITAWIATFAWVWTILDLIIAQSRLGTSGVATRELIWFGIITFSWCVLALPVVKKRLRGVKKSN